MNECVSVRESLVNTPVQHISLAARESPALSAGLRIGQGLGRGPGGPPATVFTEAGGRGCRLLPGCEDALATPSHHKGQKSQLVKDCSFLFSNSFIGIWFASLRYPVVSVSFDVSVFRQVCTYHGDQFEHILMSPTEQPRTLLPMLATPPLPTPAPPTRACFRLCGFACSGHFMEMESVLASVTQRHALGPML